MGTSTSRTSYVDDLRRLYASGLKERENDLARYDAYLSNMRANSSLTGLVREVLDHQPLARVLDVGCGDAGALCALAEQFPGRVDAMGLDLVPPDAPGVRPLAGDALRTPLPEECDLVLSFRALHEIGQIDTIVPKVARALAPRGR